MTNQPSDRLGAVTKRHGRSLVRVSPLPRETTHSYLERLARRHHMRRMDLLGGLGIALVPAPHRCGPNTEWNQPYDTWDLYLNETAQQIIADFSGVPLENLNKALPAWSGRTNRPATGPPRVRVRLTGIPSVTGCPKCTLVRTGDPHSAQQYLRQTEMLCVRHRVWMLGHHTLNGETITIKHADLSRAPEVIAAHQEYLRILRNWRGSGAFVVRQAMDATQSWCTARLPGEKIWPARARRIGRGKRVMLWQALAQEAVTYPESIAVARLILHGAWGDLRRYPRRTGTQAFCDAVAQRLRRPWLADPKLYPEDFLRHVRIGSRTSSNSSWWEHRHAPGDFEASCELTEMGYQPPRPPRPATAKQRAAKREAEVKELTKIENEAFTWIGPTGVRRYGHNWLR